MLPRRLHVLGLRGAHFIRMRWWRVMGTNVRGCRALVFDPAGHVLLLRHSYGSRRWMLPGGGMKRGEDPLGAARREVQEETAVRLTDARVIAVVIEPIAGAPHEVSVVAGWSDDLPVPDGREIVAAAFFDPAALPEPLMRGLAERMPDYVTAAKAARPSRDSGP